jgi:hypothetical protein
MVVDEVDTLFFFPAAIKSADCVFLHSNAIHMMRLTNTLKRPKNTQNHLELPYADNRIFPNKTDTRRNRADCQNKTDYGSASQDGSDSNRNYMTVSH